MIAGLRHAKAVKAKHLSAYCDSQLVTSQFSGDYDARNERMDAYLKVVQTLARDFKFFELTKVPEERTCVPTSSLPWVAGCTILAIHKIDKPSIELPPSEVTVVAPITEAIPMDEDPAAEQIEATDWRTKFINYLVDGKLPPEKWIARRLKTRSAHYVVLDGELHRWTTTKVLLKCINGEETHLVIAETHESAT